MTKISNFIDTYFLHFNAAALAESAEAYKDQLHQGNKMMITLAGAMSTAEIGKILAEMIREDNVHIISCTGANLEEDLMNLVAHNHYKKIPNYRNLSPKDEQELLEKGLNRVTDTCIPEIEAFRRIEEPLAKRWLEAHKKNIQKFPHQFLYDLLREGDLEKYYQIDPKNSWLLAAAKKNLPLVVPGWEDSTLGNIFASKCMQKTITSETIKNGIEYMIWLAKWYKENTCKNGIGFFQIGGGIAGDFPICVVPMLHQDMQEQNIPLWTYFCQISDSTTSYGSYSGAVPNEKITWGKLGVNTPKFIIESDASIVAPLIFAKILNW